MNNDYIDKKLDEFINYFAKEMQILKMEGIGYDIAYNFLNTAIKRIKIFINFNTPVITDINDKEQIIKRHEYLLCISKIIKLESEKYTPIDGSYWESVKEELLELAFKTKRIVELYI